MRGPPVALGRVIVVVPAAGFLLVAGLVVAASALAGVVVIVALLEPCPGSDDIADPLLTRIESRAPAGQQPLEEDDVPDFTPVISANRPRCSLHRNGASLPTAA